MIPYKIVRNLIYMIISKSLQFWNLNAHAMWEKLWLAGDKVGI
jgi:hypothetical protein